MTALPSDNYISNASRTVAEQKVALESLRDVHAELPGGVANTTLTIATGSVTPIAGVHIIDTEGAAASDDLANIVTTNHPDGRVLLIRNANNSRSVVVKHNAGGAGQISLVDSADLTLSDTTMVLALQRVGADWKELFREYGNNKAADRQFWGIDQVIQELLGGAADESLTISAGDVTPTKAIVNIDTEAAAASDDLDHILQTNLDDGRVILIRCANASRVVVVRHAQVGAGNIQLRDAANLTMDATTKWLLLQRRSTSWYEIARFGFVAKIAEGGTNNGSLGVSAVGIYNGDGSKIVQTTGTALQQFRVNAAGTAIEAFSASAGGGVPFGGEATRSLPTSGNWSGNYYHSGNWTSAGAITVDSGTRVFVTGTFTLNHGITGNAGQAGGHGATTVGGTASDGQGPGAGHCFNGSTTSVGGAGAGYGGAGGAGGATIAGYGGRGGKAYSMDSILMSSSGSGGTIGSGAQAGGDGGAAGACLYIEVLGDVLLNADITLDGAAGSAGTSDSGGGGGGAGGACEIRTKGTFTQNASKNIYCRGGAGGAGGTGGGGGGGGGGHIRLWSAGAGTRSGSLSVAGGSAGTGSATQAAAAGSNGPTPIELYSTGTSVRFG